MTIWTCEQLSMSVCSFRVSRMIVTVEGGQLDHDKECFVDGGNVCTGYDLHNQHVFCGFQRLATSGYNSTICISQSSNRVIHSVC